MYVTQLGFIRAVLFLLTVPWSSDLHYLCHSWASAASQIPVVFPTLDPFPAGCVSLMSFQQMKVGAPQRSGLDPLSSNKEFPPFSPKSLRPLPVLCVLNFPVLHLPGWDQGAAPRTLGSTEELCLSPFVAVSFSCAPQGWICHVHPVSGFLVVFSDGWVTQALQYIMKSFYSRPQKIGFLFLFLFISATLSLGQFSSLGY